MLELGYNEYVTQAGDWGFWITRAIGKLYPDSCKASHLNMVYARSPSFKKFPFIAAQHFVLHYSKADKEAVKNTEIFEKEGMGQFTVNSFLYDDIYNFF